MNLRNKFTILIILKSFAVVFITLGLVNCGTSGNSIKVTKTDGFQQNHGPFDNNGNYVESWADNPPTRKIAWKPSVPAKLASLKTTAPRVAPKAPPATSYTNLARNTTTQPRTTYTQPKRPTTPTVTPPRKVTPPVVAKQSNAQKITPKAKPPVFHTVKKGDTLYDLARKYGATVAAIQKANNIKGSNIVIGKRLIIPRK